MALSPCRARLLRSRTPQLFLSTLRTYSTTEFTTTNTPESASSSSSPSAPPASAPRWSQTPAGMKAKVPMDFARDPRNKAWAVNSNPDRLDEMYDRLLGQGGSKMLPEELKWLAVTHKSFDQGRRGFNHKLAMLGRSAMVLETAKRTISKSPLPGSTVEDKHGRTPVDDAKLRTLDNLSVERVSDVFGDVQVNSLCRDVGLLDVIRWKPRLPHNLEASGVDRVLNTTLCAIVGALTLQHGSAVANKVIQDKLLPRLAN